jgi:hypothetical protein
MKELSRCLAHNFDNAEPVLDEECEKLLLILKIQEAVRTGRASTLLIWNTENLDSFIL